MCFAVVGLFACAQAETYVWSGAVNAQNWAYKGNWVDGNVPPTGVPCDVLVPGTATRAPIIPEDTTFNSLGIYKDMAFTYSVEVLRDLTISNATVEVNSPIEVSGDLTLEEGAVLTHAKGNKDKKEVHVCEVTVGGNFSVKSGAKVDVSGRGYVNTWSEPEYLANASGVYGGVGDVGGGGPVGTCYGSIFAPTNYGGSGTGSMTVNAGGAFVLKATGTVTLNGPILADADQTPQLRWGGAGGSVYIRAGRLVGNGNISANGMPCKLTYTYTGGGGRISLVLTEAGADFAQYVGTVTAYGGHKDGTTMRCGGAGTIYHQKGDEKDGEGTIHLSNAAGWTMSQYDYDMTGFGYPGMDDLSKATVVLGPNSGLYLYSDCRIGKLRFDGTTADEPASVNFNGHTLTVNEPKPAASEWTDPAKYKFQNVYNGEIARKGASNLQWMKPGFVVLVQ